MIRGIPITDQNDNITIGSREGNGDYSPVVDNEATESTRMLSEISGGEVEEAPNLIS